MERTKRNVLLHEAAARSVCRVKSGYAMQGPMPSWPRLEVRGLLKPE